MLYATSNSCLTVVVAAEEVIYVYTLKHNYPNSQVGNRETDLELKEDFVLAENKD